MQRLAVHLVPDVRLLDTAEVATRLCLSPWSVRELIRRGELPASRLGGRRSPYRVSTEALADYIERRTVPARPPLT